MQKYPCFLQSVKSFADDQLLGETGLEALPRKQKPRVFCFSPKVVAQIPQ